MMFGRRLGSLSWGSTTPAPLQRVLTNRFSSFPRAFSSAPVQTIDVSPSFSVISWIFVITSSLTHPFTHSLTLLPPHTHQPARLSVTRTKNPKQKVPKEELTFGSVTTDHLLEIDWNQKTGWSDPKIVPYGPFSMDPAASVFHYGFEAFEGMKAYRDDNGDVRLFRPEMNISRLNRSCERLVFPVSRPPSLLMCLSSPHRIHKEERMSE